MVENTTEQEEKVAENGSNEQTETSEDEDEEESE